MGLCDSKRSPGQRLGDLLAERLLDLNPTTAVRGRGSPSTEPPPPTPVTSPAASVRRCAYAGRSSLVVGTEGFLRPASLRLEYGHEDAEAYYNGWVDTGALWREVFGPARPRRGRPRPARPPGPGRRLRHPQRLCPAPARRGAVVHRPLLRHWFPFDLSVHVRLLPGRPSSPYSGTRALDPARLRALRDGSGPGRHGRRPGPRRLSAPPRVERLSGGHESASWTSGCAAPGTCEERRRD